MMMLMIGEIDRTAWHPKLQRLYDYWRSKCPAEGLPRKSDIDPVEIGPLLHDVFLVAVERPPLRFRFRLLGSGITSVSRPNVIGRTMDEVYPDVREKASYRDYVICSEEAEVRHYRGATMFNPDFNFLVTERLLLPVTEGAGTVDFILGAALYEDMTGKVI